MKRTIKINVTGEDILKGTAQSAVGCPVARAIRRYVHGDVLVGASVARFRPANRGGKWVDSELPPRVGVYINWIDYSMTPVKPFSFELNVPKGVKLKEEGAQ